MQVRDVIEALNEMVERHPGLDRALVRFGKKALVEIEPGHMLLDVQLKIEEE